MNGKTKAATGNIGTTIDGESLSGNRPPGNEAKAIGTGISGTPTRRLTDLDDSGLRADIIRSLLPRLLTPHGEAIGTKRITRTVGKTTEERLEDHRERLEDQREEEREAYKDWLKDRREHMKKLRKRQKEAYKRWR